MPFLFAYILKLSISLAVMYTFYQFVLRPLTFYQWNRFYLLGYSLFCFALPFINISAWVQPAGASGSRIITFIPVIGQYPVVTLAQVAGGRAAAAAPAFDLYYWLTIVLTAGTAIMLGRLLMLYASLRRMRRKAVLLSMDAQMKLFETDMAVSPFSFGRSVYFNPQRHSEEELEQIIRHEYVHVKQHHTIDLLMGELLCLLNWYNPFAWMIRYSMRQNLEFIADNKVIENGINKKEYQYLLLKVVGISQYRIANNFNLSNLKKRIVMMNKMKTARLHLGRFLFVLPLLAVLLLAFRGSSANEPKGPNAKFFITSGIVLNVSSKEPLSGARVEETSTGTVAITDSKGFYRLSIPVRSETTSYHYVATLEGYDKTETGFTLSPQKPLRGGTIEIIGLMPSKASTMQGAFMLSYPFMPSDAPVTDPTYEDALKEYKNYLVLLNDFALSNNQRKENPEVALFYTTEDKNEQIVFLKDGNLEKYGYPGTPSVEIMEKKYGELPNWSKEDKNKHPYYDKQWQDISEKLEKTFVPTGNAARRIVFPGDSRVLVQFLNGKVEMYDMDYDKERNAFESLFGKLPGVPPPTRSDNARLSVPHAQAAPAAPSSGSGVVATTLPLATTTAGGRVATGDTAHPGPQLTVIGEPLYVVVDETGRKEIKTTNHIDPKDIQSINVTRDSSAVKKYGPKARNGVVEIIMKTKAQRAIDSIPMKPGSITWSASARVLSLCGMIYMKSSDSLKMMADIIHITPGEKMVALNGKFLDLSKDYANTSFGSGSYVMNSLNGKAAQTKYGANMESVLEINTK
ncbi:MAG TPA: M56 family metallopeptidase [Chitinophagaceae bacterium]|jgi:hypothetical protein